MIIRKPTIRYLHRSATDISPGAILIEHYGDLGMRTMLLDQTGIDNLMPWELASMLNDAYAQGQKHAVEDLRSVLGINE